MAIAALRVPFDLSAPFVVSTADGIVAGVGEKMRRYASGAPFPWRELGLTEGDIATLWNAGKVDCVESKSAPDIAKAMLDDFNAAIASGSLVEVEPRESDREQVKKLSGDPSQVRSFARSDSERQRKRR